MRCPYCNAEIPDGTSFCTNCGAPLREGVAENASQQAYQGQAYQQPGTYTAASSAAPSATVTAVPVDSKSKIAAGIFAILLGTLGIHKFYLGYTGTGLIMLLITLLTFGVGASVMAIIGLIEGIIYLTKSDEDFYSTYVLGEKRWF